MKRPKTRFTDGPDGKVAFQVVGDGPLDLVFLPYNGRWNLDVIWDHPPLERYLRRLASFSRLILYNSRGTGISDPHPSGGFLSPEDMASDLRCVVDAAGCERVAVFSHEVSTPVVEYFAAVYPERTHSLVLLNAVASMRQRDDYPWGYPPDAFDRFLAAFVENWGSGDNIDFMAPDVAGDDREREWLGRLERLTVNQASMTGSVEAALKWDARSVLSSIRAPTLVISHTNVPWIRLGHGRYVAEHIPGARYVEREGLWGMFWIHDVDWTLDEVEAFFTGTRGATALDDRVLATVLFTDFVGSTEMAARLGDSRWRQLLDEHDVVVRREIERFRGRFITSTGDGLLATFDGPARAIRCAVALNEAVKPLGLRIRTGLHTGEVEQRGDDVSGIAVNIGARVMALAGSGEVLVSSAVPPLVAGSGIAFDNRGSRELKGVPGEWHLFAVQP